MNVNIETRIFIVRHGQTEYNAVHKFDGQIDTKLSDFGRMQAQKLAESLSNTKIDIIISSPLSRAIDTAAVIAKEQAADCQIIIEPAFNEIDCGDCFGLTRSEIEIRYKDLVRQWAENVDPRFPRGENMKDVESRAVERFLNLAEENKGRTILISGHGTLNRALIGYLLHIPFGLRFNLVQKNCAINEIIFVNREKFKIQSLNA